MYHPSSETRKLAIWLYLFGSLGMLAKFPGPPPDISKILPLPADAVKEASISGIMFIPTSYCWLMLVTNVISEVAYFSAKTNNEQLETLRSSSNVSVTQSALAQTISDKLLSDLITSNKLILFSGFARNLIEIAFPIFVGLIYIFCLSSDGFHAIVVIWNLFQRQFTSPPQ